MAHNLQKALQTTISAVTWAPAAVLGMAGRVLHLTPAPAVSSTKGRAMSLSDALKGVTDNVVDTVVHYVPVSTNPGKLLVSQGGPERADKVDLTEGDAVPLRSPTPLETPLQSSVPWQHFDILGLSQPQEYRGPWLWPEASPHSPSHLLVEESPAISPGIPVTHLHPFAPN